MLEAVLDSEYAGHFNAEPVVERSLLIFGTPESAVVPIMVGIERDFPGIRTFSLPSLGDGGDGRLARRHIELGVKGSPGRIDAAFEALRRAVEQSGAEFSIE